MFVNLLIVYLFCHLTTIESKLSNHVISVEKGDGKMLFDFTKLDNLDGWSEMSDTVRKVGKSKAVITLQRTRIFQRAIFFSLLNPQRNGACFAGVKTDTQLNLGDYKSISIKLRGQGQNYRYKVCLRHKGLNKEPNVSYEQIFEVPMDQFEWVVLPLSLFEPYYRGSKQDPTIVGYLDTTNITNLEFQIFGGVYMPYKQSGISSLEIETVEAF